MTTVPALADLGRRRARRLAGLQGGVADRRQLYGAGVPRWLVRRELRVGRWQRTGRLTVAVHNGPLDELARRWVAVLEMGPRTALAGVSALRHDGVTALTDGDVHVIVPRGTERRPTRGVVVHESRRFREQDVVTRGLRRTTPAVSAVQGALWSRTAKQACFVLVVTVQQGLCSAADLAEVLLTVRRHRWRTVMLRAVSDLAGGVRSLGELDVAREMRSRGLPEPERQAVRVRPTGRQYLDADFPAYEVSIEVDGDQHDLPWARLADLLRDLALATEGRTVVRIPLAAWRLDRERVLDALEALFRSRGWQSAAA